MCVSTGSQVYLDPEKKCQVVGIKKLFQLFFEQNIFLPHSEFYCSLLVEVLFKSRDRWMIDSVVLVVVVHVHDVREKNNPEKVTSIRPLFVRMEPNLY